MSEETKPKQMPIKAEHLCPICKLGKESGTVTCKNLLGHGAKWNTEK